MVTNNEKPSLSRDERDVEIIRALREVLEAQGVSGIVGIGPVAEDGVNCPVYLADKARSIIPDSAEARLSNDENVSVKMSGVQAEAEAQLYSGPTPPPWQFSGPLMAGDPVWNNANTMYGTISLTVDEGSAIEIEGHSCAHQSVSCHHVLDGGGPTAVSTTRYPNSMDLKWLSIPPVGQLWTDVGGATFLPGTQHVALTIRGLGEITGVVQPIKGIRVSKYGATTGLTSGRDLGIALRRLFPGGGLFLVRAVSGYFALPGDSGAPVVDAARRLVGLVVSGQPHVKDESYYIQALPKGQSPPVPDLSKFTIAGL